MEILRLSKEDSKQVAENLINPPLMNEAMKKAMVIYDEFFKGSV